MNLKKTKHGKLHRMLGMCSFLIAIMAMFGVFMVPTTGKADAVHYLRPYQVTNATIYDGAAGKSFKMAGTNYSYGVTTTNRYDPMYAEFYLGGQVSSVSFTLGHLDNQDQSDGTFKLYLDEERQEEYTKELNYDMSNVTVTVNTTGKLHLLVKIEGNFTRYGMGNITMSSGHNYEAEVTKFATVNDSGSVTYTCKACGDTYQETIPARTNCVDYLSPYQTTYMKEYKEEIGSTSYITCMGDKKYRCLKTESVKAHSFQEETLTEATFGVPGVIRHVCSVCGAYYTTNSEPGTRNMTDQKISVSLSKNEYVYSGKACTPAVKVTYDDTVLKNDADYTVQYTNNIKAGTAKVTVLGVGYYKGQTSLTFVIHPKKTTVSSAKNHKRGKVLLKWKKNTQADGYEIVYSTSSFFYYANTNTKTVTKKTSVTLSRLSNGYTYYVKIRAYKKSNGTKIYGDYGNVKKGYIRK